MGALRKGVAWALATITGIALASALAEASCAFKYVYSTTDRFTAVRTIETRFKEKSFGTVLNLRALKPENEGATFSLLISHAHSGGLLSPSWRYLECHQTHILADGKPVKTVSDEATVESGTAFMGGVELVRVVLDAEAVARLAASAKIEYKVCNDEMKFNEVFIEALHEFACKAGVVKP